MKDIKCGDEVLGKIQKIGGTYAQYAVFRPNELVKKPESLTFEEAACIPVSGLTVYQALKKHLNSKSTNQKILVLGGSGGTGHFAVQLARLFGCFVYSTCSTKNIPFMESLDVNYPIDYTKQNVEEVIEKEGKVDLILDTVGGMQNMKSATLMLKSTGNYVTIAPPIYGGYTKWFSYIAMKKCMSLFNRPNFGYLRNTVNVKDLKEITNMFSKKQLKVHISKVYQMKDIQMVHKQIESRRTVGKIVIKIPSYVFS